MNLTDQASEIISQEAHTDDDIIELQKIKWRMTLAYKRHAMATWHKEDWYNRYRSKRYIVRKEWDVVRENWKKFTDQDANTYSKNEAESHEQRGWYRATIWENKWMRASIQAIDTFCIAFYRKDKNQQSASMTTQG